MQEKNISGSSFKRQEFPADKQKIIHYIQQRSRNNADAKDKMLTLQNIEINNIRMSLK